MALLIWARLRFSTYTSGENSVEVIEAGISRLRVIAATYFLCGIMGIVSSVLRGMGYSISPMITAIACICGIRIVWVYFVFPLDVFNSLGGLYLSFPVSWIIATICYLAIFVYAWRKIKKNTLT